MECELCYSGYDNQSAIPKVLKSCAHTYCQKCLTIQREKDGFMFCPMCPEEMPSEQDPIELPTNSSLLKLIEFRRNEKIAFDKMRHYEIENPKFFKRITETVSRPYKPYELHLAEVNQDELIYYEHIENSYLDKRCLAPHQYHYRKYVFHMDSIFMNYCFLNQRTRLLFLFRRLNGCQHKHSCTESILRKLYQVVCFYGLLRIPIHFLSQKISGENSIMESGAFIFAEILSLLLVGGLRSAGCFMRFMNEEIISQS